MLCQLNKQFFPLLSEEIFFPKLVKSPIQVSTQICPKAKQILLVPFLIEPGAIGLLGHLGTLLAHVQPAVHQCPQVPFFLAAQPLSTAWSNAGVVAAKVQDPAPGLVKPHLVGFGPCIQPFRSLCRALQQINILSQLGVNTIP